MEFRHPTAVADKNFVGMRILTKSLNVSEKDKTELFESLVRRLGNVIDSFPVWHPILNSSLKRYDAQYASFDSVPAFKGNDHTVLFGRGFITCPYDEEIADRIVKAVNKVPDLFAERLSVHLYNERTYPVLVEVTDLKLEDDKTINSKEAIKWYLQYLIDSIEHTEVADTWWSLKETFLGTPCGSRSSILVNQSTGGLFKKIHDNLNASGIYGPIRELSLDMLSKTKLKRIENNLLNAALNHYDKENGKFTFWLQDEECHVELQDHVNDIYIRVLIGTLDDIGLRVSGYCYPGKKGFEVTGNVVGKKSIAEKFIELP